MRTIRLQKIKIKNFKSFIQADIDFPDTDGLKLLSGNNTVCPRLGANACGKTSLLDAICWTVTGFSTNGSRTSTIINWNASDVDVELIVLINNTPVTVRRYGPPMKIELNGESVPQEKIDTLFGLNRLRFVHSIIFGQGIALFPDLPIPERGALLDEVLALNIWQKATEAAGEKCTELDKQLSKKKTDLAYIDGKLASLPTETDMNKDITLWDAENQKRIKHLDETHKRWAEERSGNVSRLRAQATGWVTEKEKRVSDLQLLQQQWKDEKLNLAEEKVRQLEAIEGQISPLQFEVENYVIDPFASVTAAMQTQVTLWEEEKTTKVKVLHESEYERKTCDKACELWQNDICPTCLQKIDSNKQTHELSCISTLVDKIDEKKAEAQKSIIELTSKINDFNKQIRDNGTSTARTQEKFKSISREIDSLRGQSAVLEAEGRSAYNQYEHDPYTKQIALAQKEESPYDKQISTLERQINPHTAQLMLTKAAVNPYIEKLQQLKLDRAETLKQQLAQQNQYNNIASTMTAAEYWKHGFKRIRLYFVKQVLSTLEIEIQSAISALGLEGWKVTLSTESETKSATIRLGVQIHVQSMESAGTWDQWSGGEKQRLRHAIAMGLASLIQRAAGVWYTFEAWDEPTSHLSGEGVADLLDSLHYRAECNKKQIWVVDHTALHYSGFSEIWTIEKGKEGSKLLLSSS
jgi:chromosome segregation ATPase